MDISKIKSKAGNLELVHPGTGDKLGLCLTIIPTDDPSIKKLARAIQTNLLKTRNNQFSPEQLEENKIAILVAMITNVTFSGKGNWNGEKPKRSDKLVKEILAKDWAKNQAEEFAGDIASFFTS